MIQEQENVFYYLTVMNENYTHPAMPEGAQEGILKGIYRLREVAADLELIPANARDVGDVDLDGSEAAKPRRRRKLLGFLR